MTPLWLALAGAYGAVGVAMGAFGAHGLRARVTPERLSVWHTATEYHLLHAVVLLGLALWLRIAPQAPWSARQRPASRPGCWCSRAAFTSWCWPTCAGWAR